MKAKGQWERLKEYQAVSESPPLSLQRDLRWGLDTDRIAPAVLAWGCYALNISSIGHGLIDAIQA